MTSAASPVRALGPDTLAALEEQRDFLLRSLADLEREHRAGDVDDHDYATLKDDYTARAARTIRAIEAHQARVAAARRGRGRGWWAPSPASSRSPSSPACWWPTSPAGARRATR